MKVVELGSEISPPTSHEPPVWAGQGCSPCFHLVVIPFIVLEVLVANLTRFRERINFMTECPVSEPSGMLPLMQTSGGGREVLLLVGARFWAIGLGNAFARVVLWDSLKGVGGYH
jgi:hypothetical protein